MPESSNAPYFERGRRPSPGNWGSGLMSPNRIGAASGVVGAGLTALTLHNIFLTAVTAIAAGGAVIVAVVRVARFRTSAQYRLQQKCRGLVKQIEEHPPPGVGRRQLPQDGDSKELIDELARLLQQNEQLCVIRLHGSDILEAPPGIGEDAIPVSAECRNIVDEICSKLEEAPGRGHEKTEAARDLRTAVMMSVRGQGSPSELRAAVLSTLRQCHLANRLIPLVDAWEGALDRPAGQWLIELLNELKCKYGVFTETSGEPPLPPDSIVQPHAARRYASVMLKNWIPKQEFDDFFDSLCTAVNSARGLDPAQLKIRCAVIAAAAELGAGDDARQRLLRSGSRSPLTTQDRAEEAMLEVRWLIDRKAALIARARDLPGAFDRLALSDKVTFTMFSALMRDLNLSEEGTRQLYDWLRSDEFRHARVVDLTEDAISLGRTIQDAARTWLKDDPQSAAYETARKAAEHCFADAEHYYRVSLVLDRTHVPAPGYADWGVPGYAGVHRYESAVWWRNVYAWSDLVAKIGSPAHRQDAKIAFTCLFLEAWWWYGDQPRPGFFDEVLRVARTILRDQPEWLLALEEFDSNYVPELELRAAAGDRWRRVAHALGFLADNLGLRQGDIPPDPLLARIYVCWCFFSGDVAEQTGSLESADAWFGEAARACGDDEDNAAMRLFARYQQADLWIPSDTDRSLRVITETHLEKTADGLGDLSVRAYVARMYGDIRWQETDIDGAFDAYGRAMLLAYVYQVRQELDELPPSAYTYALYDEMRNRFLRRLGNARESGHASEAAAAIERIRKLFRSYWELNRATTALGADPLAGIVPPLPDKAVLGTFSSGYARDARLMLTDKLKDHIAEPADQLLRE